MDNIFKIIEIKFVKLMLDQDNLAKKIKFISQMARSQEQNTTLNALVEYIVKESLFVVLDDFILTFSDLADELEDVKSQLEELNAYVANNLPDHVNMLKEEYKEKVKETSNGSNGRDALPKRNKEARVTLA